MKLAVVLTLAFALLAPVAAQASKAQCMRYNQQIGYFETMVDRAGAAGRPEWKAMYKAEVAEIKHKRSAECPGYGAAEVAAAQMRELLRLAAQGAMTFFTMGAM